MNSKTHTTNDSPLTTHTTSALSNKGWHRLLSALGFDIVRLLLLTLVAFMTAEALLPGFISFRFNLAKFVAVLVGSVMLLAAFNKKHSISISQTPVSKILLGLLTLWAALLSANALLKFSPVVIIITLVLTALIGWILYQLLFEEE